MTGLGQPFAGQDRGHLLTEQANPLSSELDQMDDVAQGPPSKRTCTTGVAGEHMQ